MVSAPNVLSALPEITWTNPTGVEIQDQTNNTVVGNSAVITSIVTFAPLLTSQSGIYTCQVSLQSPSLQQPLNISDMVTVSVQSKYWHLYSINAHFTCIMSSIASVPHPTIEVFTMPGSGPYYAGSSLHLTCVAEVNSVVDVPYVLDIVWKKSGVALENDYHISISNITKLGPRNYQSDLDLYPLSTSLDMGVYTCQVEIDSSSAQLFVLRAVHTTSAIVNVHGKFYN